MRFLAPILLLALIAATPGAAHSANVELSASITGFTLDINDPYSLPEIATISYDPEHSWNENLGLLVRNSINHRPVLRYEVSTGKPELIQVTVKDLSDGTTYKSDEYVHIGSVGTDLISDRIQLPQPPLDEGWWSFLISYELLNGRVVSKIFHVYLLYPDFEPDVIELKNYATLDDPEPQTIYEGDYPRGDRQDLVIDPETTGFLIMDDNEAHIKDMLINPILYEMIKARPFNQRKVVVPPGSEYSYTVKIHWKPVVGNVLYWSGKLGEGDNAPREVRRQKKVRLYVADPVKSVPELHVKSMDGEN